MNEPASYFAPASTDYRGAYAEACRHLSRSVRRLLPFGFFTTSAVRSAVADDSEELEA